ncbi:hypothetical protein BKA83DRAFT_681110 [Pisolithus microcarpus]|nr:hypothetical protein BKA83DRAFT_681110 [Pisolithus microcarpus]
MCLILVKRRIFAAALYSVSPTKAQDISAVLTLALSGGMEDANKRFTGTAQLTGERIHFDIVQNEDSGISMRASFL